jgi:DNA invertase Pin-like site-specific DNA recombinase
VKLIAYYRVSTAAQGRSGLGLDAQRTAVEAFCHGRSCQLLADYTEVESGSRNSRPELLKALHHAKVTGATLVIAKLDRLSRNAAFLLELQDSGVKFVVADMPEACHLTVGILALVAQQGSVSANGEPPNLRASAADPVLDEVRLRASSGCLEAEAM